MTELIILTISSIGIASEIRRSFPLWIENTTGAKISSSKNCEMLIFNPLDNFSTVSIASSYLLYNEILSSNGNLQIAFDNLSKYSFFSEGKSLLCFKKGIIYQLSKSMSLIRCPRLCPLCALGFVLMSERFLPVRCSCGCFREVYVPL